MHSRYQIIVADRTSKLSAPALRCVSHQNHQPRSAVTMAAGTKEQLHELCAAAGQQHLLEGWDSLQTNEQQQLAEDIKVRQRSH
jgi:hypothetical protein